MAEKTSTARSVGARINRAFSEAPSTAGTVLQSVLSAISPGASLVAHAIGSQQNRVATRDFVEGLAGVDAAPVAAALTAPRSFNDVSAVGRGAVTVALPQARPAAPKAVILPGTAADLTPAERQAAFVDSLFRHPLTLEQATAATGIMQKPDKQRTYKDSIIPDLVNQSTELYKEAVAQATAEPDTAKAQEMLTQARKDHFNRVLPLAGGNPLNVASAGLIDQDPS